MIELEVNFILDSHTSTRSSYTYDMYPSKINMLELFGCDILAITEPKSEYAERWSQMFINK